MTKEIEKIIARFKKEVGKSKQMTAREMKLIEICIDELVVKNYNLQNVSGSVPNTADIWNNAQTMNFMQFFEWLEAERQ